MTVEYGPIAATISAAWGKTVSTSTTVSQEITADIPAHTTVWLEATSDVTRVTGDFTVTIGATTYLLKDTTLDFPQNGGKTAYTPEVRGRGRPRRHAAHLLSRRRTTAHAAAPAGTAGAATGPRQTAGA